MKKLNDWLYPYSKIEHEVMLMMNDPIAIKYENLKLSIVTNNVYRTGYTLSRLIDKQINEFLKKYDFNALWKKIFKLIKKGKLVKRHYSRFILMNNIIITLDRVFWFYYDIYYLPILEECHERSNKKTIS